VQLKFDQNLSYWLVR